MSCMEHSCLNCGWWGADNQRRSECPECGGRVTNHFDETPTHRDDDDPEESGFEDDDDEDWE